MLRRGDTAVVSAPIAPGEKQLAFQYHLLSGRREIEIPVGRDSTTFNVLLEEPGARASAPGLALADSQLIEGRSFRRWTGELPANSTVRVTLPGAATDSRPLLAGMVAVLALGLLFAAWRMVPKLRPVSVDRLVGEIAVLDTKYQGREADTPPEEWVRISRPVAPRSRPGSRSLLLGSRAPGRLAALSDKTRTGMLGSRCDTGAAPPL